MDLRYLSDGINLDRNDSLGRDASVPPWLGTHSTSPFLIQTGNNGAGGGGQGYFAGSIVDSSDAAFEPFNMSQAPFHATAAAHQINIGLFDQSATQKAGIGGDGGDWNAAMGGNADLSRSMGSGIISSGDNNAGDGGNGQFAGALIHSPVATYSPVNIAIAGFHGTAGAHQSNTALFNQSATQIAGVGGDGGGGNTAGGGNISVSGPPHAADHNGNGFDLITSGGNHAGDGGSGYFYGSIVHTSFALYDPINIAVAGYNSNAQADQTNNVTFDQSAFQMAGVGGNGGSGNVALGGNADITSFVLGLIGSDVIATGGNSAGVGGNGHFSGSLVDLNIAIYAPINIAVAGPNSTADAHQTNNVQFDQSATQIAGVGGDGGHGNSASGGDVVMHLLADHHLLSHA